MSSLEEHLVAKIHPEIARLWAVADADGLYRSDLVENRLTEQGVETVVFDDPIAFRYRYETTMREEIEKDDGACFLILVEPDNDGFHCLPADVYEAARTFELSLGDLFTGLSRKVLAPLDPAMLSRLWSKKDQFPAAALGDQDTADLVLRIGYRIEPALLESFADLVVVLLDLHLNGQRLPEALASRLEQITGGTYAGQRGKLIRKPGAFWDFLQSEWERWIYGKEAIQDDALGTVPFTDNRIRVYVDNLFIEGQLTPIPPPPSTRTLPDAWCEVGIKSESAQQDATDLQQQQVKLIEKIPGTDATYQEWMQYAGRYSQHLASIFSVGVDQELITTFWSDLWEPLDAGFRTWITQKLDSLNNLPPTRPVVAHHIPGFLRRRILKDRKVLLLVLDGLSLSQWKAIKPSLQEKLPGVSISEGQCFTLLPSVTNVCRQAIYGGELPLFFENTINRTDCDAKRWKAFWDGADSGHVSSKHANVLGKDTDLSEITDLLDTGSGAVGATVRMPDELMHGAKMGWLGMLEQLRLWVNQDFLAKIIQRAMVRDYEVYVTADHGNLEAVGEGNLSQGVLVDKRGQRVRTYSEETLRDHTAAELGNRSLSWKSKGLPETLLPLLHTGRGAFAPEGESLVCHGGASIDELIVPFIEFTKGI